MDNVGLYNLAISQGALFERSFLWQPGGDDLDPTGYTAQFVIKRVGGSKIFLSLTLATSDSSQATLAISPDSALADTVGADSPM